jgi:hypothetical protein
MAQYQQKSSEFDCWIKLDICCKPSCNLQFCGAHLLQDEQKGLIGITADSPWYEPLTDSSQDREAAQFGIEDFIGW